MTDPRITKLAAGAHLDREYGPGGDTEPTISELETLVKRVDLLNSTGSSEAFIDAQADLINALLVALEAEMSDEV